MTSAAAKKAWATRRAGKAPAGKAPAKKARKGKKWGPGHPLYEYLKAKTGKAPRRHKKK